MRILRWLFILVGVLFIGGVWYYFSQQNAARDAVDASKTKTGANGQRGGTGWPGTGSRRRRAEA